MAKTRKDVIVIPWDYTETCEIALQHAILLANEVDNQIMLVRFLKAPVENQGGCKPDGAKVQP